MKGLLPAEKKKIKAKVEVFDFSAFPSKIVSSITSMYGSYVGRDYKLWAQVAVFILMDIVTEDVYRYNCLSLRYFRLHTHHTTILEIMERSWK